MAGRHSPRNPCCPQATERTLQRSTATGRIPRAAKARCSARTRNLCWALTAHRSSCVATREAGRYAALRGTQLECFLTLAYVSDIAGEAHCVISRDVFGHDGSVVLVERGSVANGVFRATSAEGERRAHVIWDRLLTPRGVV